MGACQTVNFAKQMAVRTSSWGGLIEMTLTVAMAFLRNYVSPGESALYNAFDVGLVSSNSCARSARAWGEAIHYIFAYEIDNEILIDDLAFSLAEFDNEEY